MKRTDRLYKHFMRLINIQKCADVRWSPSAYGISENDVQNSLWFVSYETERIEYLPDGKQDEYNTVVGFESDDLLDAIRQCYAAFKHDYQDVTEADFVAIRAAQEGKDE